MDWNLGYLHSEYARNKIIEEYNTPYEANKNKRLSLSVKTGGARSDVGIDYPAAAISERKL